MTAASLAATHEVFNLTLRRSCWKNFVSAGKTRSRSEFVLVAHVGVARRIVADEHCRQTHVGVAGIGHALCDSSHREIAQGNPVENQGSSGRWHRPHDTAGELPRPRPVPLA